MAAPSPPQPGRRMFTHVSTMGPAGAVNSGLS